MVVDPLAQRRVAFLASLGLGRERLVEAIDALAGIGKHGFDLTETFLSPIDPCCRFRYVLSEASDLLVELGDLALLVWIGRRVCPLLLGGLLGRGFLRGSLLGRSLLGGRLLGRLDAAMALADLRVVCVLCRLVEHFANTITVGVNEVVAERRHELAGRVIDGALAGGRGADRDLGVELLQASDARRAASEVLRVGGYDHIDVAVAVVVDPVAELLASGRVDGRVGVVAVERADVEAGLAGRVETRLVWHAPTVLVVVDAAVGGRAGRGGEGGGHDAQRREHEQGLKRLHCLSPHQRLFPLIGVVRIQRRTSPSNTRLPERGCRRLTLFSGKLLKVRPVRMVGMMNKDGKILILHSDHAV